MILNGNPRGGARDLALHLLKEENDHVEVHEIRGFVANDLLPALNEAYAHSKGTRAKQFLFSLSLNPPPEANASTADFEDAIERAERKLGLTGQPRAVVFHEKQGRRHAHAVWSRINTREMKAIPLPHSKRKLMDVSRELYHEHGWKMPRGMIPGQTRDPNNFTLVQWQQAKRLGKDPRAIKQAFRNCWAASDSKAGFETALKEHGYRLAKGDRRGFVALDQRCEVFSVPKWAGVKTKEVRARLGDEQTLSTVSEIRKQIAAEMEERLQALQDEQGSVIDERKSLIKAKLQTSIREQRRERSDLHKSQEKRWQSEAKERQARFRKGLRGVLDRVTGQHRRIKKRNARESEAAHLRDRQVRDRQIFRHLEQRRSFEKRLERLECFQKAQKQQLTQDIGQYRDIRAQKRDLFEMREKRPRRQEEIGPKLER